MKARLYSKVWRVVSGSLLIAAFLGGMAAGQEKSVEPQAGDPKAGPAAAPASPDETMALKRRVAGFWMARVKGDFLAQYAYLEPRQKGRIAPQEYGRGGGVAEFLAYQVEDAAIDGSFATVQVRVLVRVNLPLATKQRTGPVATLLPDQWIRVDGTWYRIEEPADGAGAGPTPGSPGR